ncbi:hypothetical protein CR513_25302, partial [Mucuna pruriens]
MVRVNDLGQKVFVKAFQKRLRARQFNDALALRRPLSMDEIRTHTEKHIEAEKDQANRLEVERQPSGLRESDLNLKLCLMDLSLVLHKQM